MDRPRDWRSYQTLWEADYRAYPGHYLPAYEVITMYILTQGNYAEAVQAADNITVPAARRVMKQMIEVAKDLNDATETGDPSNAMDHLQNLGQLLKDPPEQTRWDPTMNYFWTESLSSFVLEWQALIRRFPDDPQVRYNARKSLTSALNYGNPGSQSR